MNLLRSVITGAALLLVAASTSAAIVTAYGDDVSFTYDDSTLYGTGNVIGNSIYFQPTSFRAESLNGAGSVAVSEMLDIQVETTTTGFWMENFQLAELGDYYLSGTGASASASGTFEVSSNTSAFSDAEAFSAGPLTVQGVTTEWSTSSLINLADTVGWDNDTDVSLMIDNDLAAETLNSGEQAWTQKKLGGAIGITITAVPVPAAAWLFGSGLLGLAGWSRRRANTA